MLLALLLLIALLVAGVLAYALASNGKVSTLGLVAFGCALLSLCLPLGVRAISLVR
jgi:hypothetical protein